MTAPIEVCAPVEVDLRSVDRELNRQLREAQGPGAAPLVRARMSNLVIYAESDTLCEQITEVVPEIVAHHPARVVLLSVDPQATEDQVKANVRTRVDQMGRGLRAFSEQITLRTHPRSQSKLAFALRRMLIGDLPTNLWWAVPRPPALEGTLLYELAEHADQVIYDSYGWPEPARGLTATATWLSRFERTNTVGCRRRIASDLTWQRLRPWRRVVAEALDPAATPGAIETIQEVLFDHGPHSVTSAWSLASWMILHLGLRAQSVRVRPGEEIAWELTSERGPCSMRVRRIAEAPRGIQWMRLAYVAPDGRPSAIHLAPDGDRRLKIEPEGAQAAPRTIAVTPLTMAERIARQLSDRTWDPMFRRTMEVAQDLAITVLKAS